MARAQAGSRKATARAKRKSAKRPSSVDAKLVARLRAICLALPEADERTSHGEPTWFVGKGKVFASAPRRR